MRREIRLGNQRTIWDALPPTRKTMALWEYKIITSGLHGFASPSLLEAHLNALGKDEWEIINFQTLPNNPLAFHGLARRSTTRDWAPPEAVVTAPKPMAWDQPPAYAPAKSTAVALHDEKPALPPALIEGELPKTKVEGTSLRTVRDTERDLDPDALDEEEDWDKWAETQDELPTLFEAIKPHLRRNQRGPGMAVAIDYLAKRWDQKESDIIGALKECGFTLPETEEADPEYFEFEGDLYWVNRNNRGQYFLNTREKPRPTFRVAPVTKLSADDPAATELAAERAAEKAEIEKRNAERIERQAAAAAAAAAKAEAIAAQIAAREQARAEAREKAQAAAAAGASSSGATPLEGTSAESVVGPPVPLPDGSALLDRIRPLMRRNRRGPGYSGSVVFLARALKTSEADFVAAIAGLGLNVPATPADKPVFVEVDGGEFWVNIDSRGGIWINGREKPAGAPKPKEESEAVSPDGVVVIASEPTPTAPAPENTEAIESTAPVEVAPVPMAESFNTTDGAVQIVSPEADAPADPAVPSSEPVVALEADDSDEQEEKETDVRGDAEDKPAKAAKRPARPRKPRAPKK